MHFELHPNFIKKDFIHDLPLCSVYLENESHYPWILLVPRRPNVSKIMDLQSEDQLQMLNELDLAQQVIWNCFEVDQINVAAIGNKTPQLHLHVIGRRKNDPAWPGTVWDHAVKTEYTPKEKEAVLCLLRKAFVVA